MGNLAFSANEDHSIKFHHLGIEQGLSQGTVFAMLQDSKGLMWFGTQDGLNRFDGYTVKIYNIEPFKKDSLAFGDVDLIFEQKDSTLWIVTRGSLHRFERETSRFKHFAQSGSGDRGQPGIVHVLYEDLQGILWVGTHDGLYRYLPEENGFEKFTLPNTGNDRTKADVAALIGDGNGGLWVTADKKLFRFDKATRVFTPIALGSITEMEVPVGSKTLHVDKQGILWSVTMGLGLVRYDQKTGETISYIPDDAYLSRREATHLTQLMTDSRGKLWMITSGDHVLRFDRHARTFRLFRHDPKEPTSLSANSAQAIHEDHRGTIWITTSGGGLNRFDQATQGFLHYREEANNPVSLRSDALTTIYEDRSGTLWFGSLGNGLSYFSLYKQKFRHYLRNLGDTKPLQDNLVWALLNAPEQRVWVGTLMNGAVLYDRERDKVVDRLMPASRGGREGRSIQSRDVRSFYRDRDGKIWIGSVRSGGDNGGLDVYDPIRGGVTHVLKGMDVTTIFESKSGKLVLGIRGRDFAIFDLETQDHIHYGYDKNVEKGLLSPHIWDIVEDHEGMLWIGTPRGLNRFDPRTETFSAFRHDRNNPQGLGYGVVLELFVDSRSRLWVGTSGGGLDQFVREGETFRHFTVEDGLPNNVIYGILEDDEGNLWLSTNKGLSRFDPEAVSFRNYDVGDGLQSNEFNVGAHYRAENGELMFGGVNGFNLFHPQSLEDNGLAPQVTVSAWKNADVLISSELSPAARIHLETDDHVIEFRFAALDFSEPAKNSYSYRLSGFEKDWSPPGTRRTATYTNLEHGEYTFLVRAANSDGVWSTEDFRVQLIVEPEFWETIWFRVLSSFLLFVVILLLAAFSRRRMDRQKEEALLAMELDRKSEELEFARELQLGMLPKGNICDDRVEMVGRMITATEVGGDYFDYFRLNSSRICVAFGDATGHGVAAGLVVGMVKMTTTVWSLNPKTSLSEMMLLLNAGLRESLPNQSMGMGLILAVLDLRTDTLEICSCGMPYPIHFRQRTGEISSIVLKSPPLGYLKRLEISTHTQQLEPGDRVIFLSDGFAERFNADDRLWGEAAVNAELAKICAATQDAQEVAEGMITACDSFADGRPNDDDMTVVVLKISPHPS